MSERSVKLTRSLLPPSSPGEHFRIMCMTGKNKGISYLLLGKRVVMGRGDEVDIQVLDKNSSRQHSEMVRYGDSYIITDLGSQNGTIVNSSKVKQHMLEDTDKIIIGHTVFKFNKIVVEQSDALEVVGDDNSPLSLDVNDEVTTSHKKDNGDKAKRRKKRIVALSVAAMAITFLLPESKKPKTKERSVATDIVAKVNDDFHNKEERLGENSEKVAFYIHSGKREFREGNYLRAMEEFNLALVFGPDNGYANFYLNKSKQELDRYIKTMSEKGMREITQLKYQKSLKSFCEILRLLHKFSDDNRYKDAKEKVEHLKEKLGLEGDDVCGAHGR